MAKSRKFSLRALIIVFSILLNLLFGMTIGMAWFNFEITQITEEMAFDTQQNIKQVKAMILAEIENGESPEEIAEHVKQAIFSDPSIVEVEITDTKGLILNSKQRDLKGKISYEKKEIEESLGRPEAEVLLWALKKPGVLSGKTKLTGIGPFDWRPKAQEYISVISINGEPLLVLHVYQTLNRLTSKLAELGILAVLITLGFTVVSATASYIALDRLLYRPVSILGGMAKKIAAGRTDERAPEFRYGEFDDLASRFNKMTEALVKTRYAADTDGLTGLFNHRHMREFLKAKVAVADRYHRRLTVAMLDIDHFKQVNDRYGHQVGDQVLMDMSDSMQSHLRDADYLARYGGEEFIFILPETTIDGARLVMERIRAQCPFNVFAESPKGRMPVFVSIGMAEFPNGGRDDESLLASADMALLRAKHSGRNRVSLGSQTDRKAG